MDKAWHWMDCTKCGKLVPQEWDLAQSTKEACNGLDRKCTKAMKENNSVSKTLPKAMVK